MTMMTGLETGELDLLDEEFLGPPPRFLREGFVGHGEVELLKESRETLSMLPGFSKIRQFISVYN